MKKYLISVVAIASLLGAIAIFYMPKKTNEVSVSGRAGSSIASSSAVLGDKSAANLGNNAQLANSRSAEYLLKFEDVKSKASHGDPKAQLELSGIYDRCFSVSISREKYLSSINAMAAQAGDAGSAMKATAARIADDCALVEGGSAIPLEAQKEWLKAAADSGNIAAKVRFRVRYPSESAGNVSDLVKEAVEKKDPEAIFELTDLLSTQSQGTNLGEFETVSGDEISAYAWGVVACQMGASCGVGSSVIDSYCLNGACSSNYEQLVRNNLLPRGDAGKLDAKIEYINSLMKR